MEYKAITDIAKLARVFDAPVKSARALRGERLERLADLLDAHRGPIQLLARIEYMSDTQRASLRADSSALTIAFQDPVFRVQGLTSDQLGHAMKFFALDGEQAHHLFCKCHYPETVTAAMIAARARTIARRPSLGEVWDKFRRAVMAFGNGRRDRGR